MQEVPNLTGWCWGRGAWRASLSTGRVTKLTSSFGTCHISVGPSPLASGESCHPSDSGVLRMPVVFLWGPWQSTSSVSRASKTFKAGTQRIWNQREQAALETVWSAVAMLSEAPPWMASRFPVQTCELCPGQVRFPGCLLRISSETLATAWILRELVSRPGQKSTPKLAPGTRSRSCYTLEGKKWEEICWIEVGPSVPPVKT